MVSAHIFGGALMVMAKEIGRYLTTLREDIDLKQNELAERVSLNPAVLSRIESGDRTASTEELQTILDAIGTDDACQFKQSIHREWSKLDRPALGHPHEDLLWDAEEALLDIDELRGNREITGVFKNRLNEYEAEIRSAAAVIRGLEQTVAFVGDLGVGKTTALCRAAGLEVRKEAGSIAHPVLEVGGGGITVCEVHVVRGPEYGLMVQPRSDSDLYREVREFAWYLMSLATGEQVEDLEDDEDGVFHGTTKEIERVIRNMSGLVSVRLRGEDGRRQRSDPALDLAKEVPDADTLARVIVNRMNLEGRRRREIWYSNLSGKPALVWLEDTFRDVNNGRNPEFSLPSRVEVMVPRHILGPGKTEIRLVDTKGIDVTVERDDIEVHLNERNTVVVLCSSFNNAPSRSVQDLLEWASLGHFPDLDLRTGVLVLPRPNEALAMKDDDGFEAETVEDGYDLKGEQAEMLLRGKGVSYAGVEFFNSFEDEPDRLTHFVLGLVDGLRQRRCLDLRKVVDDTNQVVSNYQQVEVNEVQRQASHLLRVWMDNHRQLGDFSVRIERSLLSAMREVYASSVRASVRRQGNWDRLDYTHQMGSGARAMVAGLVIRQRNSFKEVAENALNDPDLEKATDLVNQAVRIFNDSVNALLQASQNFGRTTHTYDLEPDGKLWLHCESEWGKGPGYRDRVVKHHEDWFDIKRDGLERRIRELVDREWENLLGRVSAILE